MVLLSLFRGLLYCWYGCYGFSVVVAVIAVLMLFEWCYICIYCSLVGSNNAVGAGDAAASPRKKFGRQNWLDLVDWIWANFGQIWAKFGQIWVKFIWAKLGKSLRFGRIWLDLGKIKILHPQKHSTSYGYGWLPCWRWSGDFSIVVVLIVLPGNSEAWLKCFYPIACSYFNSLSWCFVVSLDIAFVMIISTW